MSYRIIAPSWASSTAYHWRGGGFAGAQRTRPPARVRFTSGDAVTAPEILRRSEALVAESRQ